MSADRLAELRRQRALAAEQLAWFDDEIAAAETADGVKSAAAAPPAPWPAPARAPVPATARPMPRIVASPPLDFDGNVPATPSAIPPPPPEAPEVEAAAKEILEEYRVAPDTLKTDIRNGCFLYFFGALALIALGVAGLWLAFRK